MDVITLQNKLCNEPDNIIKILDRLGFSNIKDRGKYITFPNLDGDNLGACSILKENLVYQNFSRNKSGNIFTLIMDVKGVNFPRALNLCAEWLGIKAVSYQIKLPFHGFFKSIKSTNFGFIDSMKEYRESDLPPDDSLSYKYYLDGVSFNVQEEFGIRYDHISNAIITPIHDINGKLVGAKARNNDSNCEMDKRFWAYLEYPKTYCLYGYYQNYKYIIEKDTLIIFESEKAVLQAASINCRCCVAIAGHNISDVQARYIKALQIKKVIVAFDEGISVDEILYNCNKLCSNWKSLIGYINMKNKYILPNSKLSPMDLGSDIFKKLIKEEVVWLKEN